MGHILRRRGTAGDGGSVSGIDGVHWQRPGQDDEGGGREHGIGIRWREACGARWVAMQRGSMLSLHGWRPGLSIGDVRASPGNACAAAGLLLRRTSGGVERLISDSFSFLFYLFI